MVTKDIIKQNEVPASARKYSQDIKLHYFGTGTQDALEQIKGYENEEQARLRKKLAITNEFITSDLLRPLDSIWSAKGGMRLYAVDDKQKDELTKQLNNVKKGIDIRTFMKEFWLPVFITDPNAILFWDTADPTNPELKIIPSSQIRAISYKGLDINWAMISTDEKVDEKPVYLYFDKTEYRKVIEGDNNSYLTVEQIPNEIGKILACPVSTIYSPELKIFTSPIHNQLGLLRSFLITNSVHEIYKYLHFYPVYWQQESVCPTCNGRRMVDGKVCPTCKGTGWALKKDVSDVFVIRRADENNSNAIPPAGYVQPDLGTIQEQRTELDWLFKEAFKSLWGTHTEESKNETATGRFIDIQPVNNKLDWFAGIAEKVETWLVNIISKWMFPLTSKISVITYGRRFIIESPDVILNRYMDAKAKFAPVKILDMLLEQFYTAEYQTDPTMAEYYLTLMKVEPYVHSTIEEVMGWAVSEEIKSMKLNFPEWVKSISVEEVITSTPDKLIVKLKNYTNGK